MIELNILTLKGLNLKKVKTNPRTESGIVILSKIK